MIKKAFKGCTNRDCEAYNKRTRYKASDLYCSKCGQPLSYVCARCWKVMPDNSKGYCLACIAELEVKRKNLKSNIVGGVKNAVGVLATGSIIIKDAGQSLTNTKKGINDIAKFSKDAAVELKKGADHVAQIQGKMKNRPHKK